MAGMCSCGAIFPVIKIFRINKIMSTCFTVIPQRGDEQTRVSCRLQAANSGPLVVRPGLDTCSPEFGGFS